MFGKRKPKTTSSAFLGFSDGPLRLRPPEEISYGTGKCALGSLLVAASDNGLVSIIVRDKAADLVKELRSRLPKAVLTRDEAGCRELVSNVATYIAWPHGRFKLPLDIRGTDFQKRVWDEVRKIPLGQTSTYSRIADAIGAPKAMRAVGSSCTRCWFAFAIPCHRVMHAGSEGRSLPDGRRYQWVAYEAKLHARPSEAGARILRHPQ
jgi:AraC family transcriptional regulator of adaptative response/methylated-DNA-[protein]-cysteine methyltransferase